MTARASYKLMLAALKDSVTKLSEMWVSFLTFIIGGSSSAPFPQSRAVQFSSATHQNGSFCDSIVKLWMEPKEAFCALLFFVTLLLRYVAH